MIALVTGPVRSGKSRFALELARERAGAPIYVATYEVHPDDAEMADRVARHRAERTGMPTIETSERDGPALASTIAGAEPGAVLIVDSLGTWLASHLLALEELVADDVPAAAAELERQAAALLPALAASAADVILVAEETGWGVVPPSAAGRLFRDQLGRSAAAVARRADQVYLVAAGFAVDLTRMGRRISD